MGQSPVQPYQPIALPAGQKMSRRKRILIWTGVVLVLSGVVAWAFGAFNTTPSPFATFASGGVVYCSASMAAYSSGNRGDSYVYVDFTGSGAFEVSWTSGAGTNTSPVYRQGANGKGHEFVLTGLASPFTSEIDLNVVSPLGGGDCRVQAQVAP